MTTNNCKPVVPPVFLSVTYRSSKGFSEDYCEGYGGLIRYSREDNPTVLRLENEIASLEGGSSALVFNSGMAVVSTVLLGLSSGFKNVVIPWEVYGRTFWVAKKLKEVFGIRVIFVWPDTDKIINSIQKKTIVFIESLSNPLLRIIDIETLAHNVIDMDSLLVVDNTFATPVVLRPLEKGADLVVHSLTKYIAGHNDVMGGAVIGDYSIIRDLWEWRTGLGGILQPIDSYLVLRGLKTLPIRFREQSNNAKIVAEFLEDHPKVLRVYYPGLNSSPYKRIADKLFSKKLYGGVVSFEVKGGRSSVLQILSRFKRIYYSPSLGSTETLVSYPIESSSKLIPYEIREKLGITEGLLRLSVGLDSPDVLLEELDNVLR